MVLLSSLFYHLLSSGVSLHPTTFLVLNISLPRYIVIVSFSRLQLGHNLLPSQSFNLSLNTFPLCASMKKKLCDLNYILFEYPAQINSRILLFNYYSFSRTFSAYFPSLLQSKSLFIIVSNFYFIYTFGF